MRPRAIGRRPASPDGRPGALILSASSGEGHVRAGKALAKAFGARDDCLVEHIDALDYTSKSFQKIYDDAYINLGRPRAAIVIAESCVRMAKSPERAVASQSN